MTEPDIRKLRELLKTNNVVWKRHEYCHQVNLGVRSNDIYIGGDGDFNKVDLTKMDAEDFYAIVPLTKVKRGLQP